MLMMRLFYGLYFLGMAVLAYHTLSLMIFQPNSRSIKEVGMKILLIPVWPLALFSQAGRNTLMKITRRL
ncbi:MAG: hypothetical protein CL677_06755 [Bdellovibrionaceae bacterium]|nr:hypothetical protein [Pseudobdellovibrionaceae bacterium]